LLFQGCRKITKRWQRSRHVDLRTSHQRNVRSIAKPSGIVADAAISQRRTEAFHLCGCFRVQAKGHRDGHRLSTLFPDYYQIKDMITA
jgi:hypothetical protein